MVTRSRFAIRSRMLVALLIVPALAILLAAGSSQAQTNLSTKAPSLTSAGQASTAARQSSRVTDRPGPSAGSGSRALAADPFALDLSQRGPRRSLQDTISGSIAIDATPVTLTMPNPGDTGLLTFSGTEGQWVFFKFTNNTFTTGCSLTVSASVRRGNAAGTEIAFKSDLCQGSDFIEKVPLTATDSYVIVFTPKFNKTGSITTTLYDVPADFAPTLVPSQAGDATTFTTATPGQNAAATFEGTAQQRVFVYFSNNTISASCSPTQTLDAWLEGPGGFHTDVRNICQFPTGDYIDTTTLPVAGTYTLKMDPEGALSGSITATLYDVPPDVTGSLTLGGPSQTITIPVRGQGGKVTFSGIANQPVTIKFTNITITQSCGVGQPFHASIVDANGSTIGGPTEICAPGNSVSATLPATGSYAVVIDPSGGETGSATLTGTAEAFGTAGQTYGVCGGDGTHGHSGAVCTADPINSLTGAFTTSETDLTLASTGIPFAFTRSYTSADPTTGRLGTGWTDAYAASLTIQQPSGDVVLHGDEGQQLTYTKQGDGSFVGAPGALSTLTFSGGTYALVRHDQVRYTFNSSGVLQSEVDRNGQGLSFGYDGSGRLATVVDATGHTVTFGYNGTLLSSVGNTPQNTVDYDYTSGQLTSVTLPDPDGVGPLARPVTHYTYVGGKLEKIIDPNNNTQVTNEYDPSSGRVTRQTDANGKATVFAWDGPTQTATATDANNHVWKDVYQNNVLIKRIDATNKTTTFEHDSGLDVSAVTSPDGTSKTTMLYDSAGNLLTATAPTSLNSVQKTFTYDAQNNVRTVTDARGKQTVYGYDANGNLNSVTLDGQPVASAIYNAQGQMTSSTDGNGKTTAFSDFDANTGLPQTVLTPDPDGAGPLFIKTTYTYDAMGNVLTKVDPLGNCTGCTPANYTTFYTYDAEGHLLTEKDPLLNVTKHTYDLAGNEISVEDANHHITTYEYDAANHLKKVTAPDPDGAGGDPAPVTTYTYDDVGNRATEVAPRGNIPEANQAAFTTTYGYDASNRLTSVTTPRAQTTYTYDTNGNRDSMVDPRGNAQGANPNDFKTTYAYDAAGRLTQTTAPDPDGTGPASSAVTTNHYDAVGNLDWTKDANQHQTLYTYDAAGRILTVTAPDGGNTTYTYDGNGNLKTREDNNHHLTTYTYDDPGRLTQVTGQDPDGPNNPQTAPFTTYTYDVNGNRTTMIDPNGNATPTAGDGKTTYTYDRDNQLKTITYSDGTPTVTYNYNAVGNRSSMVDGSGTITYGYDFLDRLKTVTRGTNTFSYTYDVAGNVVTRTYPDTAQVTYTYDEDNRLASVASGGSTTSYGYDPASHLTQTTLPTGNGYAETRSYDNAGRLIEVKNAKTNGSNVLGDFIATLDPVGNPTKIVQKQTGSADTTTTYGYDPNDRLTSVCYLDGTCPNTNDPFIRWTYDKVGNRLTEDRPGGVHTTYTYNGLDQLTQAGSTAYTYDQNGNQKAAGSRTFTYDLANRLKTTTGGGTTITYTYDGQGVRLQASTGTQASKKTNYLWDTNGQLAQLVLERDGNNSLIRRYIYGRRLLSMFTGGASYYYHYDDVGSTRNVTSSTGAAQWTDLYEPFGAVRTETKNSPTAPANVMKFAGEYLDATGLYHLRARQYDPTVGRFVSPDPATDASVAAMSATYVYAADRPTVMVDPSGMTFQSSREGVEAARVASSPNDPWPTAFTYEPDPPGRGTSTTASGTRSLQSAQRCVPACAPPRPIYSAKVLLQSANKLDKFHSFPFSIDLMALEQIPTHPSRNYWLYSLAGGINIKTGTTPPVLIRGAFEIGGELRFEGAIIYVTHRFFNPFRTQT